MPKIGNRIEPTTSMNTMKFGTYIQMITENITMNSLIAYFMRKLCIDFSLAR